MLHPVFRFGLGDFSWSEFLPRMKPKTAEEIKEFVPSFYSFLNASTCP
jgi:chromodomain-helicase-DNA-binding protein 4